MKTRKHAEGFVLTGVLALLVIASLVGGAFLFSARNSLRTAERWEGYDRCLWYIQSALEARKYEVDEIFQKEWDGNKSIDAYDVLDFFDDEGAVLVTDDDQPDLKVSVMVHTTSGPVNKDLVNLEANIIITNIATVTYKGVTRRIQENVLYEYASGAQAPGGASGGPRGVFDYAFFIDNDALFSGVNAIFNGDIRANESIELKYSSSMRINGDVYAVGLVDTGNPAKDEYRNLGWDKYATQNHADRARPAEHTDFNVGNTNTYWDQGYDETSTYYKGVERLELPYIGPMKEYEAYAVAQGGTIMQGGVQLSDAVYGDDAGEDTGLATTLDDGSLVLDGTITPIEINGVIVARGDVYIKGSYTGQGTIYAARNVYIIDDVVALDAPSWSKPDSNPYETANVNKDKDFLGLAAKGSLVFGDYHDYIDLGFQPFVEGPYTKSHAVDPTDVVNGYVSFWEDGVPYFDGDYTQQDGEFGTAVQTDGDPRLYYESILGEADFDALGVETRVGIFDCVLYANHLFMGYFAADAVVNGSIVCRDEAVKAHGNLTLNWDIRLGSASEDGQGFAPWLPGTLPRIAMASQMVRWMELPIE